MSDVVINLECIPEHEREKFIAAMDALLEIKPREREILYAQIETKRNDQRRPKGFIY